MKKKLLKYGKILMALTLIAALTLPSYATVGAADGSAFVTKAEFDAALSDFNARLTTFEAGINSKIDSQVSSYLDRNGIWNGKKQTCYAKIDLVPSEYLAGIMLSKDKKWGLTMNVSNGEIIKSGLAVVTWTNGKTSCVYGVIGCTAASLTYKPGEEYHYCWGFYQTATPWTSYKGNWGANYTLNSNTVCLYMEDNVGYPAPANFYVRGSVSTGSPLPYDSNIKSTEIADSFIQSDFKDQTGIQHIWYMVKSPVGSKTAYFFVKKGTYLSIGQYVYASNAYYSTPNDSWPISTDTSFTTNYKAVGSSEIGPNQSRINIDKCEIY